ncbi:hypothetical protein GCM10008915_59950 [Bifidobacterium pullorum subsp. gallinarum]
MNLKSINLKGDTKKNEIYKKPAHHYCVFAAYIWVLISNGYNIRFYSNQNATKADC